VPFELNWNVVLLPGRLIASGWIGSGAFPPCCTGKGSRAKAFNFLDNFYLQDVWSWWNRQVLLSLPSRSWCVSPDLSHLLGAGSRLVTDLWCLKRSWSYSQVSSKPLSEAPWWSLLGLRACSWSGFLCKRGLRRERWQRASLVFSKTLSCGAALDTVIQKQQI